MLLTIFKYKLCILIITTIIFNSSNGIEKDLSKRTAAHIPGDFIIGVLFSVHHQPRQKKSGPNHFLTCGDVRELYGIQRSEVTFKTIDEINANQSLLPNIKLGIEIRDSCWYAPVALQQSIELIRDSILPSTVQSADKCLTMEYRNMTNKNYNNSMSGKSKVFQETLIGIIGPGSSSVALQVQNLLQLFSIPQIGYSTTSKDLSDKARYSTFLRVVPSDYYQAQVVIDVVRRFNWTYISAVNTDENYGQSGIQAFRELAEKFGVCIAREDSILSNAEEESFSDVLRNLEQDPNANVVVCFCEGMTVRGLLAAMERLNLTDRFLLIGSDGWADRADVVADYERQALGSISIRIHSPYVEEFDKYYFGLSPFTNSRNPWFKEFWESKFNCQMPPYKDANGEESSRSDKVYCTGNESLSERYKQEPKLSFVIKAIYTMAYALQALQQDTCGRNSVGVCPAMYPFNGTHFLNYLMNVSFTYGPDGDVVEFDNRGDPPGRYDIMNYQYLSDGSFDYIQIGEWNNGTLNFFKDLQELSNGPVQSVCSKPCLPGYYKNLQTGGQEKRCCWVCVPCERHQYLKNETYCQNCELGYWPDELQTLCLQIKVEHVQWDDIESIVAMSFAIFGFIITGMVILVFVKHNNTPVVKASTRELCYLILVGMIISHSSIFAILAKPSKITCLLSRLLPGISFAMIYASLLVKTNRIARILAGSKKRFPTKKPQFMSAAAQLVITTFLISIETGISVTILIIEPPEIELQFPTIRRAVLACNTSKTGIVSPLAFIFLLIILCTLYALKTRNVPENFNEAKFVGFAMYTTCVIWVAFVPIYFGSESKIITMCVCISLSAMVTLIFLFLPKFYIIIFHPEKNIRALFTTSKSIRCHIGSRVASAISHKTSSSFSSHPDEYDREYIFEQPPKPIIRSTSCQTSSDLLSTYLAKKTATISPVMTMKPKSMLSLGTTEHHNYVPTANIAISTSKNNFNFNKQSLVTSNEMRLEKRRLSKSNMMYDEKNEDSLQTKDEFIENDQTIKTNELLNQSMNLLQLNSTKLFNDGHKNVRTNTLKHCDTKYNVQSNHKRNIKNICYDCVQLEKAGKPPEKFDNYTIYSINTANIYNNNLRATISEESLSECSLNEVWPSSYDCKFKAITIKLEKP